MILHNSSRVEYMSHLNPSSANLTKWLNTLKQFVGNLTTNCLSVFEHFVKLTLKGLNWRTEKQESKGTVVMWTTENKQERQHKTWRVSNYDIFWSEWCWQSKSRYLKQQTHFFTFLHKFLGLCSLIVYWNILLCQFLKILFNRKANP